MARDLFIDQAGNIVRLIGVGSIEVERPRLLKSLDRVILYEDDGCLIAADDAWFEKRFRPHNEMG